MAYFIALLTESKLSQTEETITKTNNYVSPEEQVGVFNKNLLVFAIWLLRAYGLGQFINERQTNA